MLFTQVIRLRQQEAMAFQITTFAPQARLSDLIVMSPQELIQLQEDDPAKLRTIMASALRADQSITPRHLPSDNNSLVVTALTWQVQALRAERGDTQNEVPQLSTPQNETSTPRVTFQEQTPVSGQVAHTNTVQPPVENRQHAQVAMPTLIAEGAPPRPSLPTIADFYATPQPSSRANHSRSIAHAGMDSSDEEDIVRPRKKSKSTITPKGFTLLSLDQTLSFYPGKLLGANSLNVNELLGPHILAKMISGGRDLPTFLNRFAHWKRSPNGRASHAEIEAFCLGRMIHLELACHASPKEALENRPSLEVGLRRLFALMYVEQEANTGVYRDKGVVWREIDFILESSPMSTVSCDPTLWTQGR